MLDAELLGSACARESHKPEGLPPSRCHKVIVNTAVVRRLRGWHPNTKGYHACLWTQEMTSDNIAVRTGEGELL